MAHARFNENTSDQEVTGNWTASQSRQVTVTASIGLTIAGNGGRADPEELTLAVTLTTGIMTTITHTTTIGVGASAVVPPHRTMLGEYGLRSFDVVMDVATVAMKPDRQTCVYTPSRKTRHTAHVPTIQEGWRFSLV